MMPPRLWHLLWRPRALDRPVWCLALLARGCGGANIRSHFTGFSRATSSSTLDELIQAQPAQLVIAQVRWVAVSRVLLRGVHVLLVFEDESHILTIAQAEAGFRLLFVGPGLPGPKQLAPPLPMMPLPPKSVLAEREPHVSIPRDCCHLNFRWMDREVFGLCKRKIQNSDRVAGRPACVQTAAAWHDACMDPLFTRPSVRTCDTATILAVHQPPLRRRAKKPLYWTICNKGLNNFR